MQIPKNMSNEESKLWAGLVVTRRNKAIADGLREAALKAFFKYLEDK